MALVITLGLGLWLIVRQSGPGSRNYALLELTISNQNRADSEPVKSVKVLPGVDGVKISLRLPDNVTRTQRYNVKLFGGDTPAKPLTVTENNDKTVTVIIPASELKPGFYALQLSIVNPDGSEPRVPGSYMFKVEA